MTYCVLKRRNDRECGRFAFSNKWLDAGYCVVPSVRPSGRLADTPIHSARAAGRNEMSFGRHSCGHRGITGHTVLNKGFGAPQQGKIYQSVMTIDTLVSKYWLAYRVNVYYEITVVLVTDTLGQSISALLI